ncbi:sugar ABC transporter substrate-binding protein [Alteromonas flava]|uniref:sugar ABC transporter substrate-binding protein n=1 Tax=Alteromonas flava TaxID=2048003 RepID=UPI000C286B7A|nr:extracellular solute-binding protein [Alteromonas flava]
MAQLVTVLSYLCMLMLPLNSAAQSISRERANINLWIASPQLEQPLKKIANQYSQLDPATLINVVSVPNEDLKTSIIKTVSSGKAPDIVILTSDNTVYARPMRLSSIPPELVNDQLSEHEKAALRFNKQYFGLPLLRSNRLLLFYNKALVPEPAQSWETIVAQATSFAEQNILPVGVLFEEAYWFAHFVSLFGGSLASNGSPNLDSMAMQKALSFYKELGNEGIIDPSCGYDCVSKDFYQGEVAYAINGTWALREAVDKLGTDLGITGLPSYQGTEMHALSSLVVMVFPNNSWNGPNQVAIRKIAHYLRSQQIQKYLSNATLMRSIIANESAPPDIADWFVIQEELSKQNRNMPADTAFVSIWSALRKGLKLHQSGVLDPQQTAEYMQQVARKNQRQLEAIQ